MAEQLPMSISGSANPLTLTSMVFDMDNESLNELLSSLAPNATMADTFPGTTVMTGGFPGVWTFAIRFEFIVHGVLLCTVGLLGLLGNFISIIILSRPQMKSSINTILIGLVSCDSLLIVTSIILFSFPDFRHTGNELFTYYYYEIYPYILPIVYPIGLIAQTGSAYMTLGVTIERYLVVCWPLKARSICTNGRAKLAVFMFAIFAVIYNIPRFLEVTWKEEYIPAEAATKTVFEPTLLRKDARYISIYVTWMYLVFMYIIPFSSLAVLNMLIFLEIRKANATRAILSNQEKKEHNLAVMLLVVVVSFFICNMLPLICNILEVFQIREQPLIQVSNLLVTINSSVNILIYCIFGNKFKTLFMQIFCGQKPRIQTVRTGLEMRRSQHQYETPISCRATVFTAVEENTHTHSHAHRLLTHNGSGVPGGTSSSTGAKSTSCTSVGGASSGSNPNSSGAGSGQEKSSLIEIELYELSDKCFSNRSNRRGEHQSLKGTRRGML